jgi:membrane fusion protein, multidrug efflux system
MSKNKALFLIATLIGVLFVAWKLNSNKTETARLAALSTQTYAHLPVRVVQPSSSANGNGLVADGIFMPNKEMWVLSETQGHILEVYKAKGDYVRTGDALAKIDDEILQIELQTVQLNLDKLKKDKQRLANLIDADAVAKNKIEEIELGIATAEAKIKGLNKQINNTTIRSPMEGIITYRVIEKGGVIGLGIQVAQITDISSLVLTVRVPELDIYKVKKGQNATVIADAFSQKQLNGRIRNIGVKADQAFTYDIEIEVKNTPEMLLKAGMHGRATFQAPNAEAGVFIPIEAVIGSRNAPSVYVVDADQKAQLTPIVIEKEVSGKFKVSSGLQMNDRVISSGGLTLTDGAQVKVVE